MLDALLNVKVLHEDARRCAVDLHLTTDSLETTALALVNDIVEYLRSSSPTNLIGCCTVVEKAAKKRKRQ